MLIFKSIGLVKHRIPNSIECGDQDAELVDLKNPKLVCTREPWSPEMPGWSAHIGKEGD